MFQLLFDRFYSVLIVESTLLCAILVFAVGSVLCMAARLSNVFIRGRALAVVGSVGIFAGAFIVSVRTGELR